MPSVILWRVSPWLMLALLCSAGCATPKRSSGPPTVSSYQFVTPRSAQPAHGPIVLWPDDEPVEAVEPASAIEPLAKPIYPAEARAAHLGVVTVGVALRIDEAGRVMEVRDSLWALSTPSRWEDSFRAAVEKAVAGWRFSPAQRQKVIRFKDPSGRDALRILRSVPTDSTVNVAFTFSNTGDVVAQGVR